MPENPTSAARLACAIEEPPAAPIRVVIAEDSYMIREFLAGLLRAAPGVEVAAVCADADELRAASSRRWRGRPHANLMMADAY